MRNKMMLLMVVLFLLAACPIFAQPTGGSGMAPGEVKFFGAMLGLGLAGASAESARVRQLPAPRKRSPAIPPLPVESDLHSFLAWCSSKH